LDHPPNIGPYLLKNNKKILNFNNNFHETRIQSVPDRHRHHTYIGSTRRPMVNTEKVVRMAPTRLRGRPSRKKSLAETLPDPMTMAFGGVATGSMKAQDADTVAGTIKRYGWTPRTEARAAITGISRVAVAVFEVSSVALVVIRRTLALFHPSLMDVETE